MKKKLFIFIVTVCVSMISACDLENTEEKAKKAAEEACDCIEKKSLSTCEDELNKKYSAYTNDDDFIKAFNDANDCGITMTKKTK